MPRPTPDLEAHQVAEILTYLHSLRPRLKHLPPEEIAHFKQCLKGRRPGTELEDYAGTALFYPVAVPLYAQKTPMTMGELSKAFGVPLSTATRMVDWMVKQSYAERLSDPEDRRIVRVSLTKMGRELYEAINLMLGRRLEKLLRRLTAEEREQFVSLLRKIVEIIETEE